MTAVGVLVIAFCASAWLAVQVAGMNSDSTEQCASTGSSAPDDLLDWIRTGSCPTRAAGNCPASVSRTEVDVIIIGGGVAGLSAAHHLLNAGVCNIALLEANDTLGGRVRQVKDVAPWALDAGAELIHGTESIVAQLAAGPVNIAAKQSDVENYVYWSDTREIQYLYGKKVMKLTNATSIPDIVDGTPGPHARALDILVDAGISLNSRAMQLFNVQTANLYGASSAATIGAAELLHGELSGPDEGEDEDLVKEGTFERLVEWLACGVPVAVNWPVAAVRVGDAEGPAGGAGVAVEGPGGEVMRAKRVVVAVPLTQLKRRAISFEPPLPPKMIQTIDAMNVNNAVKVWAVFSRPIWDESAKLRKVRRKGGPFLGFVAPGTSYPESWVSGGPSAAEAAALKAAGNVTDEQLQNWKVLTAFVHNEKAEVLSAIGKDAAVDGYKALLRDVFGTAEGSGESLVNSTFKAGGMFDWGKVPYIQGGYSSPSLGVEGGQRAELHRVPGGRLLFAGEHTYEYVNMALQGAMRSGKRAAEDVLKEL